MLVKPRFVASTLLSLFLLVPQNHAAKKAKDLEPSSEEAIESTVEKLTSDYKTTPDEQLTKRLMLLGTIANLDAKARVLRDYQSLEQTQDFLTRSLNTNPAASDLTSAINELKPVSPVLLKDTEFRLAFYDSTLLQSAKTTVHDAIGRGDTQTVAAISKACRNAGVWGLFEKPLRESAQESIRSLLASYSTNQNKSTTKKILEERLLGKQSTQIPITLEIEAEDQALGTAFKEAIKRRWSRQFDLRIDQNSDSSAQQDGAPPALRSIVTIQPITTERSESAEQANSTIPGRTVVTENPDFKEALYLYKNAHLIQQERADQSLEYDYGEYRERVSEIQDNVEQELIGPYIESGDPIPVTVYSKIYTESRKQLRLLDIDVPDVDKDFREEALNNLADTPPTITVQEESQRYEYTKRNINVAFSSSATIKLLGIENETTPSTQKTALEFPQFWYLNEGVHPRDPTLPKGNFSEAVLESSKSTFVLQFTADCAKAFESAINEYAEENIAAGQSQNNSETLSYGVALKLSMVHASDSQMDLDEITSLSEELSHSPSLSEIDSLLTSIALKKVSNS